ncbi:MAG: hypothetical protein JSR28_04035 [Proteobacteria bacterium]|nr:hypothetical protein [Pseudomonadota bacterium]
MPRFDSFAHVDGAAAQLRDGRILILGSCTRDKGLNTEIYDPKADTFQRIAQMSSERMFHPLAIRMLDGRILAAGGSRDVGEDVLDLEAYDPAQNRWSTLGRLPDGTRVSDMANLPDGRILFSTEEGGPMGLLAFDPVTKRFQAIGHPTMVVNGSAKLTDLGNGRVLVTHLDYGERDATHSNAYLFDAATSRVIALPSMAQARQNHEATLLTDGRVLITGGTDHEPSAELFDPDKRVFVPTGPMLNPRSLHTATRMNDGRVLIVGGVPSLTIDGLPRPEELLTMSPEQVHEAIKKARPTRAQLQVGVEAFDPISGKFSPLPDPPSPIHATPSGLHQAMPDGRVLFISLNGPIYFDPRLNAWAFPPPGKQP